jgi:hypothetical protein
VQDPALVAVRDTSPTWKLVNHEGTHVDRKRSKMGIVRRRLGEFCAIVL